MASLFWLASYPKSGNTWLRAFLANLLANRPEPVPLAELSQYGDDESLAQHYVALSGRAIEELDVLDVCALRPLVHARLAENARGTLLVKTHNYWGGYEGHWLQDPALTAGAVYVVRNPLDVVVSMSHHFGLSLNEAIDFLGNENTATGSEARGVPQILSSWSIHVASWSDVPSKNFLVIRYEDLLEKPFKPFAKIARLLALGEDRARIERAIRHASFDSLARNERRDGFIEVSDKSQARFFRVGQANQWRRVLSRAQVQRVIADHREQMKRYKYLPAGY